MMTFKGPSYLKSDEGSSFCFDFSFILFFILFLFFILSFCCSVWTVTTDVYTFAFPLCLSWFLALSWFALQWYSPAAKVTYCFMKTVATPGMLSTYSQHCQVGSLNYTNSTVSQCHTLSPGKWSARPNCRRLMLSLRLLNLQVILVNNLGQNERFRIFFHLQGFCHLC